MFNSTPGQNVLARDRAERLEGRAAVVVDQDVGLRRGGEESRAGRRIVEIARRLANRHAEPVANVARGRRESLRVAAVEHEFAPSLRQRNG